MKNKSRTLITVTAAVIEKDGLFLAACRSGGSHLHGYFEFPGGKIKVGESPESCLKRELKEEFNVECTIGAFICESVHHYDEKSIRLLGYYATHESGEFELHAHSQIKWLTGQELHKLKWAPADLPILEIVQNTSWYDRNSASYIEETGNLDVKELADKFITYLANSLNSDHQNLSQSKILDVGCGSGRDSLYFEKMGFKVLPTDASKEICAIASRKTGLKMECIRAQDISDETQYNGIWCCASLLHVKKSEMGNTLIRLTDALTNSGVLYMSFKYGTKERLDDKGRFFNDYDEELIAKEISILENIKILSLSTSEAVLRGQVQKWLNVFLIKENHTLGL